MNIEKIVLLLLAVVIAGALIMNVLTPDTIEIVQASSGDRVISVDGSGEVYIEPDIATINIGLETKNADASVAQIENNEIMQKIIQAMKDLNVDEKDIQTINYNIYRSYEFNDEDREDQFIVNNSFKIIVRDLESIGLVVDKAVELGANQVNSIQFSVIDQNKAYKEALDLAVIEAKDKANQLASNIDEEIESVVSISENSNNYPVFADMGYVRAESAMAPIETGQLTIRANVSVKFKY